MVKNAESDEGRHEQARRVLPFAVVAPHMRSTTRFKDKKIRRESRSFGEGVLPAWQVLMPTNSANHDRYY